MIILQNHKFYKDFYPSIEDSWTGPRERILPLQSGHIMTNQGILTLDEVQSYPESQLPFDIQSLDILRSFKQSGDNVYRRLARILVLKDIPQHPLVAGKRLSNFVGFFDFFGQSSDEHFKKKFFKILKNHYRYAKKHYNSRPSLERIFILFGLLCVSGSYEFLKYNFKKFLKLYEKDLDYILKSTIQCAYLYTLLLKDLIHIKSFFKRQKEPSFIRKAIEKMTPLIRLMRHGDGELSKFEISLPIFIKKMYTSIINHSFVDELLSLSDSSTAPLSYIDGMYRFALKPGLFLVNTSKRFHHDAYCAGDGHPYMQFEWSCGKHRIIKISDVILQNQDGYNLTDDFLHPHIDVNMKDHNVLLTGDFHATHVSMRRMLFFSDKGHVSCEDHVFSHAPFLFAARFVVNEDVHLKISSHCLVAECPTMNKTFKIKTRFFDDIVIEQDHAALIIKYGAAHSSIKTQWVLDAAI
jgi:uncharacterized heparinase superfamily protein